jgi:hypothetical protein
MCKFFRLIREVFTQIRESRAVPIGPNDEDDDENGEDWEYVV